MPGKTKAKKSTGSKTDPMNIVLLLTLLIAAIAIIFFFWQKYTGKSPATPGQVGVKILPTATPKPTATPTPTPVKILHGKEVYSISQSSDYKGPRINKATVDPLDPNQNQTQTITVKTIHSKPVDSVSVKLTTDNKIQTLPLKLVSGTALEGDWQISQPMTDTYLWNYLMEITAVSGKDKTSVTITIRSSPWKK